MLRSQGNFLLLAKVVTAYVGSVIGAGFASGQEIMQFFILHGCKGLLGVVLSTVLFAYLGGLVMFLSIKMRSTNYKDLLIFLLGAKAGKIVDVLNLLMLMGGLCVMMAGSAAVFGEHFGLPARAGVWVVVVVTSLVIMGGLDGVLTANVVLVPLKLLAVVLITLTAIFKAKEAIFLIPHAASVGGVAGSWVGAGLLYVSYNMVVPVAVLSSLGGSIPLKIGVAGGMAGGFLLGLAVSLVTVAGLLYFPEAAAYEIPLLFLASQLGLVFYWLLGFLIWLAIITTAIADAHGIASRLAPRGGLNYRIFGICACLLALPVAGRGFSDLVRLLYPIFGYVSLLLLICLLIVPPVKVIINYKNSFIS
ncbi:MAG: hypothetical protein A4E52_00188 [Pelotomaculum sp. PtaB.Bin013]|uniref:Membrane protein YkvI n=1 Tax=Pelotomaculum isophthalicicum JI TaxID=947010 RepID=A0A9X4GYF0_9FIRM|nr:hypothetical protein [Pelotomaculum isophthalicicum]MDF9407760.1 hypothetical protein [Pelotomaculum isophthalicicum JI]OPX92044.1 MAG: hypothetical protein A4E52_00188 [Pelotomaculum sp. PtaB.Bin013]